MTEAASGYGIEVVHLDNGNFASARTLSAARESKGVLATVAFVAAGTSIAAGFAVCVALVINKVVFLPAFFVLWSVIVAGLIAFAVPKTRARLGRYTIGARLDNDAFAALPEATASLGSGRIHECVDLVRRRGERFELTVLPGMHGFIENGRAPIPVEALICGKQTMVSLDLGASAELTFGPSRFVIRSRPLAEEATIPADWMRPFAKAAVLVLQLGLVASLFCFAPGGRAIDDRMASHMNLKKATPWEAEKWLRVQAQQQAPSLYQCFEGVALACQRPGYVGIGVSLAQDGEIRSHWIAKSTYDAQCPVENCMSEVIGRWQFDPLPHAMRVVLPVQVLRTNRPLTRVAGMTMVGAATATVGDRRCGLSSAWSAPLDQQP